MDNQNGASIEKIMINQMGYKNLIITGTSGYVGTALLKQLRQHNVIAIDRNKPGHEFPNVKIIQVDLAKDTEKLNHLKDLPNSIVIHLAAARSDDATEIEYKNDNLKATENFLKRLNPKKIVSFIHIGSVAAIDGEILTAKKSAIATSDDWYRVTKYHQQRLIEDWSVNHNVPLTILAPSAIFDENAKSNSTNIGRLEKAVKVLKILPKIKTKKSLTPMSMLTDAITTNLDTKHAESNVDNRHIIQRFLVIERPVLSIDEIGIKQFGAKYVIHVPYLEIILLFLANTIKILGLQRFIPLTKHRVVKLFKSTNYLESSSYGDWHAKKTNSRRAK